MLYRIIGSRANALLADNPVEFVRSYASLLPASPDQIGSEPFDSEWYMRLYPDVEAAVAKGKYSSAYEHFTTTGFFAGRLGAPMPVDEYWYREAYPDVDRAVSQGGIDSAASHFRIWGFFEGRAASALHQVDEAWYKATYPSVVWEIEFGYFSKAQDHYNRRGFALGYWASRQSVGKTEDEPTVPKLPAPALVESSATEDYAPGAIRIKIGTNGNLGNKIFQYMYCRSLQDILPGSELGGYNLPEFDLVSGEFELGGRVLTIRDGNRHSMASIAYQLKQGIYDALLFDGYVQRLEYYPNRDVFAAFFRSNISVDRARLGPGNVTINVRGQEVLRATHPNYNPVPVSFFEHVANTTRLDPVIVGQLGDDAYSEEIRRRFSGCIFIPSRSPIEDFEIVRQSTNIALSVSTFSWTAAWLSNTAQTIHLPVSGFLHPHQAPDVDLLPTRDGRYRFYQFPIFRWQATKEQLDALISKEQNFRQITPAAARALIR